MAPTPYVERLRSELSSIKEDLDELLDHSSIRYVNPNTADSTMVFLGAADWGWASSDAAVAGMQMSLIGRYSAWFDRFQLLFPHPTPQIETRLQAVDDFVRRWVTRPDDWDHTIPRTIEEAKALAEREMRGFHDLLDVAAHVGTNTVVLVPDTNALIRNPDLASYWRVASVAAFRVHLLPPVLQELDELKDRGRTQELRSQAQAVVRRLKGLRDKGSLAAGVKLTRDITVQAEAREVDVTAVLNWLDPAVPDDRIVAAALRLQSDNPAGFVVLVTSDLNLQNKADAAGLPYVETPPSPSTLRSKLEASIEWSDGAGAPHVVLSCKGPATARDLSYSVSSPPESAPPRMTAGPWSVAELRPGASDRQEVYGLLPPVVVVAVSWTDDEDSHDASWNVDFPERPAAVTQAPRRTR
jgi:rRNA maturation endonuclease Nob1